MEETTFHTEECGKLEELMAKLRNNYANTSIEDQKGKYKKAFNNLRTEITAEAMRVCKLNELNTDSFEGITKNDSDAFFITTALHEDHLIKGLQTGKMQHIYDFFIEVAKSFPKMREIVAILRS